MATAQEQLRISISPLNVLRRYICPRPQKSNDSMAAVICLYDFIVLLLAASGNSLTQRVGYHPPGEEEHPKDDDEASSDGDRLHCESEYTPLE